MKDITNTELLIIRNLKRKGYIDDAILKRLIGKYYALSPLYVGRDEIFNCLFSIIEKFDLLYGYEKGKNIRIFFIYKESFMNENIDMWDMWIQKAKSRIRLSDVSKFPRYPESSYYRNWKKTRV